MTAEYSSTQPGDDREGSDTAEDSELPAIYRKGGSTEGILPIAGYIIGQQVGNRLFDEVWGTRIAIIALTLAAGWAVVQRKRRGQAIGWWIPSIAVYLFLRGIAGLIWGEDVFLAIGIGVKVLLGLVALGSVLIKQPIAAKLAPLVLPFPKFVLDHAIYLRTMSNLTLGYAIYQLLTVGFEIWLLGETSSGTGFFLIRTGIGWVAGFVGFFAAAFYADRSLKKIDGFSGVLDMFEEIGIKLEEERARAKAQR